MKKLFFFAAVLMITLFSCGEKGDDSIYEYSDSEQIVNDSNGESSVDNNSFTDNSQIPDNQTDGGDVNNINDYDELPDVDADIDTDVELPDGGQIETCGNGELETGEVCERGVVRNCVDLDSQIFTDGKAYCKNDCTGWNTDSCTRISCEEAKDVPDSNFIDSNCDGIDGDISKSIFVDKVNGLDSNDGSMDSPVQTINKAIDISDGLERNQILVSEGAYLETVELKSGVSIHGGYSGYPSWVRQPSFNVIIVGGTTAVYGTDVSDLSITFIGVLSENNFNSSGNSYAVKLVNSSDIILDNVKLIAGKGGPGGNGIDGTHGVSGSSGGKGSPGCEDSGGIFCTECDPPSVGAGGESLCSMNGGDGGAPGKDNSSGSPGSNGAGSTNNGGDGGISDYNDDNCVPTPGLAVNGKDGEDGNTGDSGQGGESFGLYNDEGYIAADGYSGENGGNAQGGGGGGGGQGGNSGCASYGSSGGGGGGGGCGGTGGTGGKGGGASVALWLFRSDNIVLVNCELETSDGGVGGNGGTGGHAGMGGAAGAGGAHSSEQDDGGCGGKGGVGGNGGRGGHGGGGGGGPSIGIVIIESSVEGILTSTYKIGLGGIGGAGDGNSGKNGKTGQTIDF